MIDNKRKFVFLGILFGLFLGILFLIRTQFNVGSVVVSLPVSTAPSIAASPVVSAALAEFVNAKGEHWRVLKVIKSH